MGLRACQGWYVSSPNPQDDTTHSMCRGCIRLLIRSHPEDGDIEPAGDGVNCPNRLETPAAHQSTNSQEKQA